VRWFEKSSRAKNFFEKKDLCKKQIRILCETQEVDGRSTKATKNPVKEGNPTMEKHNAFLIAPQAGQIIGFDLAEDRGAPDFEAIRSDFLAGAVTVFTLPSGDRIVAGPGAYGKLDTKGDEFKTLAHQMGAFAVLNKAIDPTDADAKRGFSHADGDMIAAEIVGPAILVGPKPAEGEDDLTETSLTLPELRRTLAFNRAGLDTPLAMLLALLGRAPEASDLADSDEREWDESVHDPELVEFRKGLTDKELADCPCPGCHEEQERRVVAAGGSTLKH
jgi:hypothetical protein